MNGINECNNYIERLSLDTPLLKCCVDYFISLKKDSVKFEELETSTKDLNDYKNVSAIAYYALKHNSKKAVELLERGLDRISKKKIEPNNLLVIDDMSLFSLALSIVRFELNKYNEWLKNLIFENNKFYFLQGSGFAVAIDEYIKGNHQFSQQDYKYCAVKIWLENNEKSKDNVLELQCEFVKEVWLKGIPFFEDEFYNILAIGVINSYISEKFQSGIAINEKKYQKALKRSSAHSRIISIIIITPISAIVFCITAWFFYKIWQYEITADSKTLGGTIKWVTEIVGLLVIPIGFIKFLPRIHKLLSKFFNVGIKYIRGL